MATLETSPPVWLDWVGGWYWQTDSAGRLTVFRPGAEMPAGLCVEWSVLAEALRARPALLACWSVAAPQSPGASLSAVPESLQRLGYCLGQQVGWADELNLPWPDCLPGFVQPSQGWYLAWRGATRLGTQGEALGLHGVCVPRPPATEAGRPVLGAQAHAEQQAEREAEQEALRYAISHDLRAPLRVVEGFTKIIKEDYGHVLDKLGQDHLDRVLSASVRMNGMIDAILAQAQLAGAPLQRVSVDITALARDIGAEMLAGRGQAGRVDLQVSDGLRVDADPQMVRRVLDNLIGNAIKYSGKVALPKVEVGVMPATNPAVFFVRDNGAGFDMLHADKLFGMFQRLHSAKEFPGTGVGLAGVRSIIQRHGGRVWAEAKPGVGACFYFTLMDAHEAQQRATRSQ